ncbi:hypothetical protein HYY75_10475 [bacterium]|nr:hypothetical protein [bacterium]
MAKKRFGFFSICMLVTLLIPGSAFATQASELNDSVLFFVNDPQELTFTDMNKLVERNRTYHQERGTLTEDQVSSFFSHMQEYGVKEAGKGTNQIKVAYVVQNEGPEIRGVIVVKGEFDRPKLLETLKKHYGEHSQEHSANLAQSNKFAGVQKEKAENPFVAVETNLKGHQAHVFPMPLKNRELIVVSSGDCVLLSSSKRGNRELLLKTLDVIDGKLPIRAPAPNTKVVMNFSPTSGEKKQLEDKTWARYDKQRQDSLSQKKRMKKLGERIRQKVIRNKIQFFVDSINDMDQTTLTIERGCAGEMTKTATIAAQFENSDRANEVKKKIMKHLIREIKRNDNVQDKFALGNISITSQGNQAVIRCKLNDSKEQLHAFHLISSYVAKGLLERL